MDVKKYIELEKLVALLAEGVDRNRAEGCALGGVAGRPPRGGRG